MTDQTETATCPYCPHPAHRPGVECEGGVDHGPKHWHRCLCLNLIGSEAPCHPLMDCQGGKLGYSDIWYLQRGHTLSSADGPVTPDVLTSVSAPSAVPAPAADRAAEEAYRLALSTALRLGTGANWEAIRDRAEDLVAEVQQLTEARVRQMDGAASADRATVYAEVADRLAADAEQGAKEGFTRIYRRSAARQVREWGEELRRLAVEARPVGATAPAGNEDCERCEGTGLDPDAYFQHGDTWTHAPCSSCQPEDDETAQRRAAGGAQQPEPVVTVHAAADLSPAAEEALGALVEVAKRQIIKEQ